MTDTFDHGWVSGWELGADFWVVNFGDPHYDGGSFIGKEGTFPPPRDGKPTIGFSGSAYLLFGGSFSYELDVDAFLEKLKKDLPEIWKS